MRKQKIKLLYHTKPRYSAKDGRGHRSPKPETRVNYQAFLTGDDFDSAVDIDKGPVHFTERFQEEQEPLTPAIKANIDAACSIIKFYREAPFEADLLVEDVIVGVVLMVWMELKRNGYVKTTESTNSEAVKNQKTQEQNERNDCPEDHIAPETEHEFDDFDDL